MLTALQAVKFIEWLTLAAIFLGPICAVWMTRFVDGRREKKANRLAVFKTLMRTRGSRLNHEHVGALNLVEIEFYKEKNVSNALQRYFDHLNTRTTDERWLDTSNHLFTKLLYEIAKSLGYKIEQLQILTGGYAPQGWIDNEGRQEEIQNRLIALLQMKTALPITTSLVGADCSPSQMAVANDTTPRTAQFAVPPGYPPVP